MLANDDLDFLRGLELLHKKSRAESNFTLKPFVSDLRKVSLCLETLHLVSTCATGCRGGDHLHEYLVPCERSQFKKGSFQAF
jgi:hypothetical protein